MPGFVRVALVAFCPALLTACVGPYLSVEDRKEACDVAVEEKFGGAVFQANPLSGGAGPLAGAGQGFLGGLQMGQGAILLAPIGLVVGAAVGTACAVAGARHPSADADFERLLQESDAGLVKRTLEARLMEPRAECGAPGSRSSNTIKPDARVEIESIRAGMSCLVGQQEFWVAAKWRTVSTRTGRVLAESTTRREHKSAYSIEDWFADPSRARGEIEALFQAVGQDMAKQFTSP